MWIPEPQERLILWKEITCAPDCNNMVKDYTSEMLEIFFNFLKKLHFYNTLTGYAQRRNQLYIIPSHVRGNLLDFEYLKDTKLYSKKSDIDKIPKGPRFAYSIHPSVMGENLISLICYLNDLEKEGYFSKKYDYAITVYTLNKITQWITPFTTETIPNIIPAYNPSHVFTCNYYNTYIMKLKETSQWHCIDFKSAFNDKHFMENCYRKFMTWYSEASSDERIIFNNHFQERATEIFLSFIYCPEERIFFPATTLIPEERSKKNSRKHCLAFFYCLYDRFYYNIVLQIEKSFIKTCENWLNNNDIWSEFKKIHNNYPIFCFSINEKYLKKVSEKELEKGLKKVYGECLGKYFKEHLEEYLDLYLDLETFGEKLLIENLEEVMKQYKIDIKDQKNISYLYPCLL